MVAAVGTAQVSTNVAETQAWFEKVTAQGATPTRYDQFVLDAFSKEGVTASKVSARR
jgi:hypothetical protein